MARGPMSAPLILATRDRPEKESPLPLPPAPGTQRPPPPQLLPRPPNLLCLRWGDTHFEEPQTLGPDPRGLQAGRGRLFSAPSRRFRSGGWAAALLGPPPGSGGAGAYPQRSGGPGRGCPAGAGLGWAARAPLLQPRDRPGAARRRGNPGFMRPGARRPAAQDDIKSPPPPARTSPRAGGGAGLRQEPPGGRWEL